MLALKLAYRNLIGAGLRTWLNVIVLSFSFVVIIFFKGLLDGWDRQAKTDSIAWEFGGGQYWQKNYDPYDPFTLTDSHEKPGSVGEDLIKQGKATPILITQGSIYPEGRIQSALLKGIDTRQQILEIPSSKLDTVISEIPAIIGTNMAKNNHLKPGDVMMVRWRNTNGTFDANQVRIVGVFSTNVPSVDGGQLWIPLDQLRKMMLQPDEATILVTKQGFTPVDLGSDWVFKNNRYLLRDIDQIIKAKSASSSILYFILLLLAMLAIFDTQVLSIFRRQKEIGTYIAMGMTRRQVVGLFTVEGSMYAILAILVGSVYGVPLFISQVVRGFAIPGSSSDFGIAMAQKLYPVYSFGLVITTILIVTLTTTLVSYLPARKIAKMNPTEAIKGKLQ